MQSVMQSVPSLDDTQQELTDDYIADLLDKHVGSTRAPRHD